MALTSLLGRIRWENIMRLVVILVFVSISILSIYNFIEIRNLRGKYKLSEERIGEIYKDIEDITRNSENSIKGISTELINYSHKLNEFISENDFDTVFIVGRKDNNYYRDIKISKEVIEIYDDKRYHVIGEFKTFSKKKN